eukprot:SAG31_NODE_10196_length_1171_cov_1.102516_1_plen_65_part_01
MMEPTTVAQLKKRNKGYADDDWKYAELTGDDAEIKKQLCVWLAGKGNSVVQMASRGRFWGLWINW